MAQGEMGSLPDDARQDMMIDMLKDEVATIKTELEKQ